MAFLTFKAEGRISYGIVRPGGGVYDLGARMGSVLPDLRTFLAAQALDLPVPRASASDYAEGEFTYEPLIPNPGKILCVGLNYVEHRKETGRPVTQNPAIFTRFADSLIAHRAALILPSLSASLDYEGECAIVIAKPSFRLHESQALDHIAGFSIFNDASIREWQHHSSQFIPGKNFPGTGAFGPMLVTPEEFGSVEDKKIETRLNGNVMQSATLGDMIFSIPRILAYVTSFTALSPGDVIATGTPGGVGAKREPPVFMRNGDQVDVTVEGIGALSNTVAAEISA